MAEHQSSVEAKLKSASDASEQALGFAKSAEVAVGAIGERARLIETEAAHVQEVRLLVDGALAATTEQRDKAIESSKAVETLKAELESVLADVKAGQELVAPLPDQMAELITQLRAAATNAAAAAEEARKSAAESAKRSKHVSDGAEYIDQQRTALDGHVRDAQTKLENATTAATSAQAHENSATASSSEAGTAASHAKALLEETEAAKSAAESDRDSIAGIVKLAGEVNQRVSKYEGQLSQLQSSYELLRTQIESLLPGATSAGLAAAFHERRGVYWWPRLLWTVAFLVAIVGLVGIGVAEVVHYWSGTVPDYGQVLRSLLFRLPIVGALVWLGLLAGSKARAAERAEETYAHKEAISRSFEGYKKEFASLGQSVSADSPVAKLCERVLSVLAMPPVHADGEEMREPTPITAAVDAVGPVLDKVTALVEAAVKARP